MGFYIQSLAGVETSFGIDRTCQSFLCVSVGQENARSLAIVTDPRVHDDCMDRVAVGQGSVKALQNKNTETLASPITSATVIEGVTFPIFVGELARLVSIEQ
jgi:hypothetical protein